MATHCYRSHLKKAFWPNLGVGPAFRLLEILQYVCGSKRGPALILDQNSNFEIASNQRSNPIRILPVIFILLLAAVGAFAGTAPPGGKSENALEKIQISSDKLITDGNKMYFEFLGNVRAFYEGSNIKTDSLKIYYRKQGKKDNLSADKDKIKLIVATGNVDIRFEDKIALADKAVYDTDTMVFALSGKRPKVISGKNTVTGSKITLYRQDGRAMVEGSQDKKVRVQMTIFASKKDVNILKKDVEKNADANP